MEQFKNLLTSTALIPLWAKAVESQSENPILTDDYAYPILKQLGYDLDYYSVKRQNPSQVGCCLRAKWIDDETIKFVNLHEHSQVIQLGAGLDDRFRRLGMPESIANWYDLDLEEVAEMRRAVIPEVERNSIIGMDMFDTSWMKTMKDSNLPTLIIIEGVLMYLDETKIGRLLRDIAQHFRHATLLFDSVPKKAVGKAKYHDSVNLRNHAVEYTWGAKDQEYLLQRFPEIKSVAMVRMSDLEGASKFMLPLRLMYKIPYFYRNYNQLLFRAEVRGEPSGLI